MEGALSWRAPCGPSPIGMNGTATLFISYLHTQSRVVFLCRPGAGGTMEGSGVAGISGWVPLGLRAVESLHRAQGCGRTSLVRAVPVLTEDLGLLLPGVRVNLDAVPPLSF